MTTPQEPDYSRQEIDAKKTELLTAAQQYSGRAKVTRGNDDDRLWMLETDALEELEHEGKVVIEDKTFETFAYRLR